ncbi:MAG: PEP-utilizing enzyme [Candidatus Hodarchaeota archaeon]
MGTQGKTILKFVLKGWAANSFSRTEGIAFIAFTPNDARNQISAFKDKTSRVLVCPSLDWSWSDIANAVDGVVTDHGTRVSRGSEVSGIVQVPAVLGTNNATSKIQDGDFIEIICSGNEAVAKVFAKSSRSKYFDSL